MPQLPMGMRPLTMRVDMHSADPPDMPGSAAAGDSAAAATVFQANFARSRHLALKDPEYWRRNGPPKSRVPPSFPRFVGGRKLQPLTNNSEGARSLLHPDPWSTATLDTLVRRHEEGTGHLFATHTIKGHSAILVHPRTAAEQDQDTAESDVSPDVSLEASPWASPRFLTRSQIHLQASRAVREAMPRQAHSLSARAKFGKGVTYSEVFVDEGMVPRRSECRGKYIG